MQQRIAELEARVRDLEARLKLNSTNSSKPPSSDPVGLKRQPPAPPSKPKRGGQPGHRNAHRVLVPPAQVAETIPCKPTACRRCGHDLVGEDSEPLVHEVAELPRIQPVVTESFDKCIVILQKLLRVPILYPARPGLAQIVVSGA